MKTYFILMIRKLLIVPALICFMSFSVNEQKEDSVGDMLNKSMKEQLSELQQVAGFKTESFTDEAGYLAIKIIFDQTAIPYDGYSKAFSRSAKTPMRNISSSLLTYSGTDVFIRVYAKAGKNTTTANALRSYFINDGIDSKRIKAEGFESSSSDGIEISIRVGQKMIQDAKNGILLD